MEKGQAVWLRSTASRWGWVPALVHDREEVQLKPGLIVLRVTLRDDPSTSVVASGESSAKDCLSPFMNDDHLRRNEISGGDGYYNDIEPFEVVVTIDMESAERDELEDIKIRDNSAQNVVGGVDDLIGLTHLHEPAILHALRLRYDSDVIYTCTGPILIAINPFKSMPLYTDEIMDKYRQQGESGIATEQVDARKTKGKKKAASDAGKRLPPHAYLIADDAYRAMMRGIETNIQASSRKFVRQGSGPRREGAQQRRSNKIKGADENETPTNQSILVSGESGAGKTVTTKIVLNYFAMLSKIAGGEDRGPGGGVEQQVLDSNPILEAFGNARTIRNDNSSRFGKYIDIRFSPSGKLTGATIDTYLLEKVRLIHQTEGERNFHVFYQFLESASKAERDEYFLGDMELEDFALVNQSGTYDRRDMVKDTDMHTEMLDAMVSCCIVDVAIPSYCPPSKSSCTKPRTLIINNTNTKQKIMGFKPDMINDVMRLMVAILYGGNMTFSETNRGETCVLDENEASLAVASLLGVSYEKLASSLTSRVLFLKEGNITKELNARQAFKATEALIKSIYGANFDYIVKIINQRIHTEKTEKRRGKDHSAYIGEFCLLTAAWSVVACFI